MLTEGLSRRATLLEGKIGSDLVRLWLGRNRDGKGAQAIAPLILLRKHSFLHLSATNGIKEHHRWE